MVESYKTTSKIATAAGAICTIISILGVDQLHTIFPGYSEYIPIIVAAATWYLSQTTENHRVEVAEQLIHEQYTNNDNNDNVDVDVINDVDPATEYEETNENVAGEKDAQ